MKPSRLLRPLLLGTAFLFAATSTALLIEKHRLEKSVSALLSQRAALELRLHQTPSPPHPAATPPHETPAPAPSIAPFTQPPSTALSDDPPVDDPALQSLKLIAKRAAFPTRYAPFLRTQPLTDTQLTALENLLSQRDEQHLDLDAVIRSHRLSPSDPAVSRLRAQASREFRQHLTRLIGEQPAGTLVEFERKLPAWELVGNFAGTAALEGQPITPDQAVELAEVIANASPSYQAGNDVAPADVDWPAVIDRTVAVLTPPQAASFRNMAPRYPISNPASGGL